MDNRVQLLCLWCGPLMAITLCAGFVMAGFLPPPGANLTAIEIAKFYQTDTLMIRLGMLICISSLMLIAPWGIAIAMRVYAKENTSLFLFCAQISTAVISAVVSILGPVFWALAAFRPFETAPDIIQSFNDAGWFLFLITWPPFSWWFLFVGLSILHDNRPKPGLPRWAGYASFWAALLIVPAGLIMFFKTGPFAWSGILSFYIPAAVILTWVLLLTFCAIKSINEEGLTARENASN